MKPAPIPNKQLEAITQLKPEHDEFTIFDLRVRVHPNGPDWPEQKGRTLSYILDWFNRRGRSFPDDPDRLYYLRGWDPFPSYTPPMCPCGSNELGAHVKTTSSPEKSLDI